MSSRITYYVLFYKEGAVMNKDLFTGDLIRLTMEDPQVYAEAFCRWSHDSEYRRLLGSEIAALWSVKKIKEWIEKEFSKEERQSFSFNIHTLQDDKLIGDIGLDIVNWSHGEAFVGIGLGERDYWGKGYGSDAMRVILRYAFTELNLRRVSLDVFEYNPRAIKSYEKVGFVHEGRMREYLNRDGRRWDLIFMGILYEEWEESVKREEGNVVHIAKHPVVELDITEEKGGNN
jgi:RimJ/RimL family protein N-acetyltransferase